MRYCTRCVYPANHPLGMTFDDRGVCSGCRVHEEKDEWDWGGRRKLLERILDGYRLGNDFNYDCVIPVSGARDSYFIVHTIVKEFRLRPLLVTYNIEYNTNLGLRNLAYLRTLFDCDHVNFSPSPDLLQKITRKTLVERGSIYWHCLAGHTAFPVQVAVRLRIPLIVWGAHQGIDQVGMFSRADEVEMTRKYRKEHDLMGLEAEDLVDPGMGISPADVEPFRYPDDADLAAVGVRGIYLENYIRWDSKAQHETMIDLYGFETMPQQRTFDTYNHVDCVHYSGLHDYIKFLKWGYGKVTDHVCREIRLRRLERFEAIALVEEHTSRLPEDTVAFCDWIGMDEKDLFALVDRFRHPRIWERQARGQWRLLDSVGNHMHDAFTDEVGLGKTEPCEFVLTDRRDPDADETRHHILIRGHCG